MTNKPSAKTEKTCAYCQKTFSSYGKGGKKSYCCQKHYFAHLKALHPEYLVEMTCAHCGKPITVKRNCITTHNYCSTECHARHREVLSAEKKAAEHTQICERCGKSFVPKHYRPDRPQRFCSYECSGKINQMKAKPRPDNRPIRQCAYCGKEIRVKPANIREYNYCCTKHAGLHARTFITDHQKEILQIVIDLTSQRGYPPALQDIATAINTRHIRAAGVVLEALEERGYVHVHHGVFYGIEILKLPDGTPASKDLATAWQRAPGGHHSRKRVPYTRLTGQRIILDSSYEIRFAEVLDTLAVNWICHVELKPIRYTWPDGSEHGYTPDFYVKDWNIYFDTKGWFNELEQKKISSVRRCHPEINLIVVTGTLLILYERSITQPLLLFA